MTPDPMNVAPPNAKASTDDFEFQALAQAKRYRQFILEEFHPYIGANVLEIGSGIGQFTTELQALPKVKEITCVEPDPGFAAMHRKQVSGVRLIEGISTDLPPDIAADTIISINVLEHIEHDAAELCHYAQLLQARQGRLCLLVPARPELYSPIDADFGHFRRYTKKGLSQTLEQAGFECEHLFYFNWVGYFAWLLNFRLLKARSFNLRQVQIHDRLVSPVVHWMESRIARPPFGQSLIAIARSR